jgi:DNA-binding NtrC family response regulator
VGKGKGEKMVSSKKTILIIDDDVSISKTFSRILDRNGYETDTAVTGKEAIEKAKIKTYAAALIDIRLPDFNGDNLMNILPKKNGNGKMVRIIITGTTAIRQETEADAYLLKPVKAEELLSILKEKLEK